MHWLTASPAILAEAAAKAALMSVVALIGFRVTERRTLSEWTAVDFVTAVAIGAVIGRTAVAKTEAFATGAVALIALLVVHAIVVRLRFLPAVRTMLDHPTEVLVEHGTIHDRQLRRCGLTRDDLDAALRQRGVFTLADVRFVLYEAKGGLTIVPADAGGDCPLLPEQVRGGRAG